MTVSRQTALVFFLSLVLLLSSAAFHATTVSAYAPRQGDTFSYHEVQDLGSGTGSYAGYTEHTVVNGTERMDAVGADGVVSAHYGYTWTFSNSSGATESGRSSGNFTFSPVTFLYVKGTDNQTGYVNPSVWFYMNGSLPMGATFSLLNTQMTVVSTNYSYYLPSRDGFVQTVFAQGTSSYLRNDVYGQFAAAYTWSAYFDPSTGFVVGYGYVEHDRNSTSGDGFTYTENLYVTATSYPLAAASNPGNSSTAAIVQGGGSPSPSPPGIPAEDSSSIAAIVLVFLIAVVLVAAVAGRSRRRGALPRHPPSGPPPPPEIDLIPKQPPVQEIVIKEVAKVNCKYCGTLIDSTAQVCPRCGAPRT